MNRPEMHEHLYNVFCSQTVRDKRLYVLDESVAPSPFFSRIVDTAVVYRHEPAPPPDGVTHIGRARNRLNSMTTESVLLHLDDDDWIDPVYGEFMIDRLGDADLCKLDVFDIYHAASGCMFRWDTRSYGGTHYVIKGAEVVETTITPDEMPASFADALHIGYGFSFVLPRKSWVKVKFPDSGTEDIPWARELRDQGGRIVFVSDAPHLVRHLAHEKSNSPHYATERLGPVGAAGLPMLRAHLRSRMLDSMQSMYELPQGRDITLEPGARYSILACIKNDHTLPAIDARVKSWGLTLTSARDNVSAKEFGAKTAPKGYRLAHFEGQAGNKRLTMPWSAPTLIAIFDKTTCVRAWCSTPPAYARGPQVNAQLSP